MNSTGKEVLIKGRALQRDSSCLSHSLVGKVRMSVRKGQRHRVPAGPHSWQLTT